MIIKNEDKYFLLTDLYFKKELVLEQVKTEIVINRNNPYYSYCLLYPSHEDAKKCNLWEVQLKGNLKDISGKKTGKIQIDKAYLEQNNIKHFPEWKEIEIKFHPSKILVTRFHENKSSVGEIRLNLTKNKFLKSKFIDMGEKENSLELIKKKQNIVLNSADGSRLVFDEFLIFHNNGDECYSAVSQMLKAEKSISGNFPEKKWLENIDYLLWFISFCTNTKMLWTNLTFDRKGEIVEYFRCNMKHQNNNTNDEVCLIKEDLIQEFLQKCLERTERKDAYSLYLPLIYFVSAEEKTLEFKFLALFMSLVALVNLFCKSQGVTNQVPMKGQFEEFCNFKRVDVSDLWPIFDKEGMSLYRIRNKLVHGENLNDFESLDIACEHLKWIAIRCILADLDWQKSSKVEAKELSEIEYYNFKKYAQSSKI